LFAKGGEGKGVDELANWIQTDIQEPIGFPGNSND